MWWLVYWECRLKKKKIHLEVCGFCSVQSLSHAWLSANSWTAAGQASLSITNSQSLLKLMSIESVMTSNHLICLPLLLLPSIFPSIRVFSSESVLHIRWPRYWSFSIRPFNEYWGLLSLRIDWFNLLEVQRLSRVFSSPEFENINSLALSLLYVSTLICALLEKP